jgi:hypothetical protein
MRRKIRMQDPQQPDQALSPITGTLAVDVFGLALAPSFLRAICSIPSFGIAKFAVNVCSLDTNKNANKTDGCSEYSKFRQLMHSKMYPNSNLLP